MSERSETEPKATTDSPKTADEAKNSLVYSGLSAREAAKELLRIREECGCEGDSRCPFCEDDATEALTQARREGRREGLEEAAKLCDVEVANYGDDAACELAYNIRALIDSGDT